MAFQYTSSLGLMPDFLNKQVTMLKKKMVKLRMKLPMIQTTLGILSHLPVARQSYQGLILKMVFQKHSLKVINLILTRVS